MQTLLKNFELVEDLAKKKVAWLKERETLRAEAQETERLMKQVANERDHLQSSLQKQGDNFEEALKRHVNMKAKYDELRANSALTEAKLLIEVSSLQTQVSEQRGHNLEILQNLSELRKEKDAMGSVDWAVV